MKKPLYQQIKENILKLIEGKSANTPIPSERELGLAYEASRMTVRKAVQALVEDGYLYRDKNKGTFIADKKLRKKSSAILLDEDANVDSTYKILYFDIKARSEADVQEHLETDFKEYVLRVVRVVEINKKPICIEEIYSAMKNISDDDLGNLKRFLNLNKYIEEGGINQTFVPILVPTQYAVLLHLKMNTPIIRVDNLISKKNGKPFIFVKSFYNPNHKKINITA